MLLQLSCTKTKIQDFPPPQRVYYQYRKVDKVDTLPILDLKGLCFKEILLQKASLDLPLFK